jgi:hypothetical protein
MPPEDADPVIEVVDCDKQHVGLGCVEGEVQENRNNP